MHDRSPSPTLPDHLSTVIAGHRAFRRDTRRFIEALGRLDPADRRTTDALVAWFAAATRALHHHHTIEDEILWPALRERSRAFELVERSMHDEHVALDAAIDEATRSVAALGTAHPDDRELARRRAEEAAVRLRALLLEHLDHEERAALPLLGESFTVEEYHELDRRVTDLFAPKELGFGACWYLDAASPEEHAVIWAGLPLAFRVPYRFSLRRSYRRIAAVLPD